MSIEVSKAGLHDILRLRDLYRQAMNCQIVHDSYHERGRTDLYLITVAGAVAGYGAVAEGKRPGQRDMVIEFYTLPRHRPVADALFRALLHVSQAARVQAQTNDVLLSLMLYDCTQHVKSETLLFADQLTTHHRLPNAIFRPATGADAAHIFRHTHEPVGDWVVEAENAIVATGGVYFHYNRPYGDIFMEVDESARRRGYGSYLVQELKRVTYEMGSIPAARCNVANVASRYTLQKAGLVPCARILSGRVALSRSRGRAHRTKF